MTTPDHDHDDVTDLVRDLLDREAARVDPGAVLARVKGRSKASPTRRAWLRATARAGAGVAVAAGVGGLYLLGHTPPVAPARAATAEELLTEAKAAHEAPADRCYEVTAEWTPALFPKLGLSPVVRKSRLWTRGDQFWIESAGDGASWAWGQDARGGVWVALNRKRGLVYAPGEIGEPLGKYCNLMSLRVVSTLADVLERFELFRKDTGRPGEPVRIEAKIRPTFLNRNPRFSAVAITLDTETKVIREAVLTRQVNGETVANITFTLAGTGPQPDDRYELRGHLDADAEVLDRTDGPRPDRRARFRDEFIKRLQQRSK